MYNSLTTFRQQVVLYAVEIGYKATHLWRWEGNLRKASACYVEEDEDLEEAEESFRYGKMDVLYVPIMFIIILNSWLSNSEGRI